MNTVFSKRKQRKWTCKIPKRAPKTEMGFILYFKPGIMYDEGLIVKVGGNDHKMLRLRISLDLKRKRIILVREKSIHELVVKRKKEEFIISVQDRYSVLTEVVDLTIEAINNNFRDVITEGAVYVGGRVVIGDSGKLPKETKYVI